MRLSTSPTRTARKSAIISSCSRYRYELRRIWDDALPPYVSGMLNPSTADGQIDDRTIVANLLRAEALGCGSLIVWNLGAGRATKPKVWKAMAGPIGPENDSHTLVFGLPGSRDIKVHAPGIVPPMGLERLSRRKVYAWHFEAECLEGAHYFAARSVIDFEVSVLCTREAAFEA
jgi:hypothetical protein